MSAEWWIQTDSGGLAQGDLLPDCRFPVFVEEPLSVDDREPDEIEVKQQRLIIVTQTCYLENNKVEFVALCPIHTLSEFEEVNLEFAAKGRWENVRKGRIEGLHLLAAPDDPANNQSSLVVDFGHIISLPLEYLTTHAESTADRWRLQSPFLEHFSQAFARFFMRVGLPSSIPPFK